MKTGDLLLQKLERTNVKQLWEIVEFKTGGLGEISLIEVRSLSQKNTIDSKEVVVNIPSNMVTHMVDKGVLILYKL